MFYGSMAGRVPVGDSSSARDAASAARRAESKVEMLELDVERLLMITEALWTCLKEQLGYSENDLIRKVAEIDLRDGSLNGRVDTKTGPVACPHCQRMLQGSRPICLYCGKPVARDPFTR